MGYMKSDNVENEADNVFPKVKSTLKLITTLLKTQLYH